MQQRWIELVPTLAPRAITSTMSIVQAFLDGKLAEGAPVCQNFLAAGPLFKAAPLSALATVPIPTWRNFGGHLLAQAVNAQAFSKQPGDNPAQYSVQLIGKRSVHFCKDCWKCSNLHSRHGTFLYVLQHEVLVLSWCYIDHVCPSCPPQNLACCNSHAHLLQRKLPNMFGHVRPYSYT